MVTGVPHAQCFEDVPALLSVKAANPQRKTAITGFSSVRLARFSTSAAPRRISESQTRSVASYIESLKTNSPVYVKYFSDGLLADPSRGPELTLAPGSFWKRSQTK